MNDRENVDENEDDDVLCSLLSRHSYDVDCKTFSGAGDVVSVKEQLDDDAETQSNQSTNLTVHTHTTNKPYKCDVCRKGFYYQWTLKTHKRTHTGDKPYICDVCNTGFARLDTLETHKRTHTGERPYVCEVCTKTFTSSSHLAKHKRLSLIHI